MKKLVLETGEVSRKWIRRLRAVGVDVLGIHPGGGRETAALLDRTLAILETDSYRELLDYAAECGLSVEYEIHAGSWLLPRDLFESHPEYFREDEKGERTPDFNFCVSNREALDIVTERAALLAGKLYRSTSNYYFWMDDTDHVCRCEKCRTLSPSDQQLKVMNAVVRRLRVRQREAKVAYLAYNGTETAPVLEAPQQGIFLEYAPIWRDMGKSPETAPGCKKDNLGRLLDLFGRKDAWLLEYWYDNSLFSNWKKPPKEFLPDNALIREGIRYYRGLGFDNIGSFACYLGREYEELYGEPDVSGFAR